LGLDLVAPSAILEGMSFSQPGKNRERQRELSGAAPTLIISGGKVVRIDPNDAATTARTEQDTPPIEAPEQPRDVPVDDESDAT